MEEEKKPGFAEPKRGRSRRRREEKKAAKLLKPGLAVAAAGALLLAAGIGGLLYWNEARRYESCFFPGTQINGMDVSKKTAGQVKAEILAGLSGYRLAIVGREGASGTLSGEDIGLHAEFDGSLEKMLDAQNPMEWWKHKDSAAENQRLETMVVYEEEKLQKALDGLEFLDEAAMKEPENARISDYMAEKKGYEILSAYPGTELIPKKVKEAVSDAVMGLSEELDLEEAGCYTKPAVEADDGGLLSLAAELNRYVGASVTHTFGEKEAVLDGDTIHQWLSIDGQTVMLDEGKVSEYVAELANTYDTAYKNKTLKTSYGPTVTISRGNYGWRMNKAAETAAVLEIIKNGEQKTREPEYTQKAASHGERTTATPTWKST